MTLRQTLFLVVATLLYLLVELAFSARLLDVVGGAATPEQIHSIEIYGRTLSGIALALVVFQLLLHQRNHGKKWRPSNAAIVLICSISAGILFVSLEALTNYLSNSSSPFFRHASLNIVLIQRALVEDRVRIDGLTDDREIFSRPEGKAFLALFPVMATFVERLEEKIRNAKLDLIRNEVAQRAGGPEGYYKKYADAVQHAGSEWKRYNAAGNRGDDVDIGTRQDKAWNDYLCAAFDETHTRADVELLWSVFADGKPLPDFAALERSAPDLLPAALRRTSAYLTHPVFNSHHSETGMLRYIRQLSDKDLALDRSMIPLGSCTMKLNATSEMIPITWPEFANVHPLAPADQQAGYAELDAQLRRWLATITGYADVSLQPNAGSQGEYAGLLAIKAWHAARGDANVERQRRTVGQHPRFQRHQATDRDWIGIQHRFHRLQQLGAGQGHPVVEFNHRLAGHADRAHRGVQPIRRLPRLVAGARLGIGKHALAGGEEGRGESSQQQQGQQQAHPGHQPRAQAGMPGHAHVRRGGGWHGRHGHRIHRCSVQCPPARVKRLRHAQPPTARYGRPAGLNFGR